jgi:hypothetical protein
MLNPGDLASFNTEYEFIQSELKVIFGWMQNLFATGDKVIVLEVDSVGEIQYTVLTKLGTISVIQDRYLKKYA